MIGINGERCFDPVGPDECNYRQKSGDGSKNGFNPENKSEAFFQGTSYSSQTSATTNSSSQKLAYYTPVIADSQPASCAA
jgi:hypothetical protein